MLRHSFFGQLNPKSPDAFLEKYGRGILKALSFDVRLYVEWYDAKGLFCFRFTTGAAQAFFVTLSNRIVRSNWCGQPGDQLGLAWRSR